MPAGEGGCAGALGLVRLDWRKGTPDCWGCWLAMRSCQAQGGGDGLGKGDRGVGLFLKFPLFEQWEGGIGTGERCADSGL